MDHFHAGESVGCSLTMDVDDLKIKVIAMSEIEKDHYSLRSLAVDEVAPTYAACVRSSAGFRLKGICRYPRSHVSV